MVQLLLDKRKAICTMVDCLHGLMAERQWRPPDVIRLPKDKLCMSTEFKALLRQGMIDSGARECVEIVSDEWDLHVDRAALFMMDEPYFRWTQWNGVWKLAEAREASVIDRLNGAGRLLYEPDIFASVNATGRVGVAFLAREGFYTNEAGSNEDVTGLEAYAQWTEML